jgi:signal transduction histidine kinase
MATLESHNDRHASPRTHDRPVRRSNRVTTSPIVPAGTDDKDAEADEQHCLARFRSVEIGVHRSLAAATDISVVAEVLGTIAGALGGVHAELWLANDRSDSVLHPIATWTDAGHDGRIRTPNVLSCGVGLAGTACRTGEPVWSADLGLDKPLLSPGTVSTGRLAAAVAVPVRGGRHAIGALVVLAGAPWPYDASAVDLLTGAAAHMGEFLQRRRAEALVRELDRAKDEYIALVGHELRTPLTSIVSFTDLIADLPDDTTLGECRDLLNVVRQHGNGLRGIVEDLLDLAALDTDQVQPVFGPVDLADVVRAGVAEIGRTAAAQGVELHVELSERLTIQGANDRLRQLVGNLIGNAVKYSPDGGRVTVTLTAADGFADLTVTDTGIGIPDAEREHVFRRFYRSTRARDRGIPGTGLGLALSRTIAELHHGTITLLPHPDSRRDTGTAVVVRLPLP